MFIINYFTKLFNNIEKLVTNYIIGYTERFIDYITIYIDKLLQKREKDYKIKDIENLCKWKFESIWDIIFLIAAVDLIGIYATSVYYLAAFMFSDLKYRNYIIPPFPIFVLFTFFISIYAEFHMV